jgi:hypothetical protein
MTAGDIAQRGGENNQMVVRSVSDIAAIEAVPLTERNLPAPMRRLSQARNAIPMRQR